MKLEIVRAVVLTPEGTVYVPVRVVPAASAVRVAVPPKPNVAVIVPPLPITSLVVAVMTISAPTP